MNKIFTKFMTFVGASLLSVGVYNASGINYVKGTNTVKCNNKDAYILGQLDSDRLIVSYKDASSTASMLYENGTCREMTILEKLEGELSPYDYYYYKVDKVEYTKYAMTTVEGYVLNTWELDENNVYYLFTNDPYIYVSEDEEEEIEEEEEEPEEPGAIYGLESPSAESEEESETFEEESEENEDEPDYHWVDFEYVTKHKSNQYYVEKRFKHITSLKKTEGVTYYSYDEDSETFTIFDGEITEDNAMSIYTLVEKSDVLVNKTYEFSKGVIDEIDALIEDDDNVYSSVAYANENVYLMVSTYGKNWSIASTKYYDKNGEVVSKLNDKMLLNLDNYYMICDLEMLNCDLYDSDDTLINKYEFTSTHYALAANDYEDKVIIYFLTTGESLFAFDVYNKYYTLDGDNTTYSKDDLTFRFSGLLNNFKELKINGNVVDSKYYTLKKGSTIVTLSNEYLNTLANGDYTISAVYNDGGIANASFKVNKEIKTIDNPETFDNILITGGALLISAAGIVVLRKKIKTN